MLVTNLYIRGSLENKTKLINSLKTKIHFLKPTFFVINIHYFNKSFYSNTMWFGENLARKIRQALPLNNLSFFDNIQQGISDIRLILVKHSHSINILRYVS